MVGELVDSKADIGATSLYFTGQRVSIIEYITLPSKTSVTFIFRAPQLSYTNNLFLLPFNNMVWLCLVALVLVTGIILTAATYAEWLIPLSYLVSIENAELCRQLNSPCLCPFVRE